MDGERRSKGLQRRQRRKKAGRMGEWKKERDDSGCFCRENTKKILRYPINNVILPNTVADWQGTERQVKKDYAFPTRIRGLMPRLNGIRVRRCIYAPLTIPGEERLQGLRSTGRGGLTTLNGIIG